MSSSSVPPPSSKVPRISASLRDVAIACRAAALEVLEGARTGDWAKTDIAAWLVGPYRAVTRLHLSAAELAWADVTEVSDVRRPSTPAPLSDDVVDRVLTRARREVVSELARFASGTGDPTAFVFRARARGNVIRCVDATSRSGFVPVAARPGSMRLSERVLSLFAADYLLRPKSYHDLCTVCTRCGTVVFDPRARTTLDCGMHIDAMTGIPLERDMRAREQSGVQLKAQMRTPAASRPPADAPRAEPTESGEPGRDTWREFPAVEVPPPPKLPRVG